MQRARFAVEGMSCGGCVKSVTAVLNRLDGVDVQEVSIGEAEVSFDPTKTSPSAIAEALADAGYPTQPAQEHMR